ncbi:MAG: hypothetical protein R3B97_15600 [Dehalococcoidia bacterium]|nr:hypothetical protein [Dehalococcoidia bacterium]MCB9486821.1 hypothetical protein [Thermoflexaceae bacterium]
MRIRTTPLLLLGAALASGVFLAIASPPAVASASDDVVCTQQIDNKIDPASGPAGTAAVVSWNFGSPGPLVVVTWDDGVLLNGVEQRKVDDCYQGVDIVVPADAAAGAHEIVVSCAYCLVPAEYARVTFTVVPEATPSPTVTATATPTPTAAVTPTPPAPRPPNTGNGSSGEETLPGIAILGLAMLFAAGVVAGIRQIGEVDAG